MELGWDTLIVYIAWCRLGYIKKIAFGILVLSVNLMLVTLDVFMSSPVICYNQAQRCNYYADQFPHPNNSISCQAGAVGRYLMLKTDFQNIVLCEVEVYGTLLAPASSSE